MILYICLVAGVIIPFTTVKGYNCMVYRNSTCRSFGHQNLRVESLVWCSDCRGEDSCSFTYKFISRYIVIVREVLSQVIVVITCTRYTILCLLKITTGTALPSRALQGNLATSGKNTPKTLAKVWDLFVWCSLIGIYTNYRGKGWWSLHIIAYHFYHRIVSMIL